MRAKLPAAGEAEAADKEFMKVSVDFYFLKKNSIRSDLGGQRSKP